MRFLWLVLWAVAMPTVATVLFQDDFKSSSGTTYSWGSTFPMTSNTTFVTQAALNWNYSDWSTGIGAIDYWPPDHNKFAYSATYVHSEDAPLIAHGFDLTHTAGLTRPTHLFFQWKEYRSSNFDCGPTKDMRITAYQNGDYGGLTGAVLLDNYMSTGTAVGGQTSGTDNCTTSGLHVQGTPIDVSMSSNDVAVTSYAMPRATVVTFEWEIQLNTPGNSDGLERLYINGTKTLEALNIKLYSGSDPRTSLSYGQFYIDGIALVETATNGAGNSFNPASTRWITDVILSNSYIGTNDMAAAIADVDTMTASLTIGVTLGAALADTGAVAASLQTGALMVAAIVDVGVVDAALTNGSFLASIINDSGAVIAALPTNLIPLPPFVRAVEQSLPRAIHRNIGR